MVDFVIAPAYAGGWRSMGWTRSRVTSFKLVNFGVTLFSVVIFLVWGEFWSVLTDWQGRSSEGIFLRRYLAMLISTARLPTTISPTEVFVSSTHTSVWLWPSLGCKEEVIKANFNALFVSRKVKASGLALFRLFKDASKSFKSFKWLKQGLMSRLVIFEWHLVTFSGRRGLKRDLNRHWNCRRRGGLTLLFTFRVVLTLVWPTKTNWKTPFLPEQRSFK